MRLEGPPRAVRPRPALPSEAPAVAKAGPGAGPSPTAGEADRGVPFGSVLRRLGHRLDEGERATAAAERQLAGGGALGAGELLVLQARIYRYSEAVDLSAKLVDRATNGVRTVLQGS